MLHLREYERAGTSESYHLQTNNTTTNDNHLLGDLLESKSAGASDDALLINLQAGERGGLGTGGNEDVLATHGLLTTLQQVDLDGVGVDEGASTLDVVDAVLLQQELNTLGQTIDGRVLGLHHLGQVQLHIADLDTALLGVVEDLVVEMRVVEEGLGRDTADVQASTAELAALLDACGLSRWP